MLCWSQILPHLCVSRHFLKLRLDLPGWLDSLSCRVAKCALIDVGICRMNAWRMTALPTTADAPKPEVAWGNEMVCRPKLLKFLSRNNFVNSFRRCQTSSFNEYLFEIEVFLCAKWLYLPWWHRKALTQWPQFLNVIVPIRSQVYACWE